MLFCIASIAIAILPCITQYLIYEQNKLLDVTMMLCIGWSILEYGCYVLVFLLLRCIPFTACVAAIIPIFLIWVVIFYGARTLQCITLVLHYVFFPWNVHEYATAVSILYMVQITLHGILIGLGILYTCYRVIA